jgi:hypothetical protein
MRHWILLLLVLIFATPTLAVDGVLEINQTCAVNTGCFSGDAAGFPVKITAAAGATSFALTSDLNVANGGNGISIEAPDVSVDFHGFTLAAAGAGVGGIVFAAANNEVRNGTVRGFNLEGIFGNGVSPHARVIDMRIFDNGREGIELQTQGSLVEGCRVANNSQEGIEVRDTGLVLHNVVSDNGGVGLLAFEINGRRPAFGGNVFAGNNGGLGQTSGGVEISPNVCANTTSCP